MQVQELNHVWLFATPRTVACQASSVHEMFQARILEWVAISSSSTCLCTHISVFPFSPLPWMHCLCFQLRSAPLQCTWSCGHSLFKHVKSHLSWIFSTGAFRSVWKQWNSCNYKALSLHLNFSPTLTPVLSSHWKKTWKSNLITLSTADKKLLPAIPVNTECCLHWSHQPL